MAIATTVTYSLKVSTSTRQVDVFKVVQPGERVAVAVENLCPEQNLISPVGQSAAASQHFRGTKESCKNAQKFAITIAVIRIRTIKYFCTYSTSCFLSSGYLGATHKLLTATGVLNVFLLLAAQKKVLFAAKPFHPITSRSLFEMRRSMTNVKPCQMSNHVICFSNCE